MIGVWESTGLIIFVGAKYLEGGVIVHSHPIVTAAWKILEEKSS